LLGLRRDLLTAASYGVGEFLFVYGDKPSSGDRTGELTVRTMIDEARSLGSEPAFARTGPFRVGTAAALRQVPAWKKAADFMFVQVSYSLTALLRWRDSAGLDMPVYAGVMVIASESHARRMAAVIPDIDIPEELIRRVGSDRLAGVEAACEQVLAIRDSGAFDGVHLVPVARYREMAARLEQLLS
jgi:methylenetetrahydrofolate reductase (NADPH)